MTHAMMKETTKLMPLWRHKPSQKALVLTPVDEVLEAFRSRCSLPWRVSMVWVMRPPFWLALDSPSKSPQRLERGAKLGHEDLRLFPGREVSAFLDLVVVDELGIRPLRPAPRSLIELIRKGSHRDGDGDVFRSEEGELAFPIQTSR